MTDEPKAIVTVTIKRGGELTAMFVCANVYFETTPEGVLLRLWKSDPDASLEKPNHSS